MSTYSLIVQRCAKNQVGFQRVSQWWISEIDVKGSCGSRWFSVSRRRISNFPNDSGTFSRLVGEGWRRLANSIRVTMKMVKRQAMCHRAVELAETCNTSESLGVLNLDIRFRLSQATWGSYKTEGLEGNTDSVQRYSAKHHRS